MCGITGVVAYGDTGAAPVDHTQLRRMRDAMAVRGPDGAGEWFRDDGRVALAHRRLAIIDLDPRASQPMVDAETGNVIVFNGEIYDYRDLKQQLAREGVQFLTESDTEVLLHLYARYGDKMLDRIRGMFAFAIWDARHRRLFCARDPLGIKPLYYAARSACA
jgi:asparagine synthase (glutamine-hydrolysing)